MIRRACHALTGPPPGWAAAERCGYLAQNISALDTSLTPDDLSAIEEAAPERAVLGIATRPT